jgi:branched-chain amino acid transport system ATP-binding protein
LLGISGVSKRFGGIVALDGILRRRARPDLRPDWAQRLRQDDALQLPEPALSIRSRLIEFEGRSLLETPRHGIAALGIGRTFQNLGLFRTMSVLQNILVGVTAGHTAAFCRMRCACQLSPARKRSSERVAGLVDFPGARVAHVAVRDLPFGTQKRVERRVPGDRAQAVAARRARGGLNHADVDALRQLILDIRERSPSRSCSSSIT